ncbi:uncharacterized protein LOC123296769 [Chrysoperla carnea]|uniref:uncharacterized protein LOC123296769 n=1 Tax=Chrysoperla carnea TaxID=189513 RepID=UPI001D07C254|nr:uncharacterized protein LOC123296769 [Chrysoperla carnea]
MWQSRFIFITVCYILYTFHSEVLNPFATEVTVLGSDCPGNITGLSTFPLSALNGVYKAVEFYSPGSLEDQCYRIRFTPINDNKSKVRIGYKTAVGLPLYIDFIFLSENVNGSFKIMDSITGAINLGEAYILSNGSAILYYSCRPGFQGLLKSHSSEVLVLTQNDTITWTPEDEEKMKDDLRNQTIDYGIVKPCYQGPENCNSMNL